MVKFASSFKCEMCMIDYDIDRFQITLILHLKLILLDVRIYIF